MPTVLNCQGMLYQRPGAWSQILENAGFEVRYPTPGGRMLTAAELIANLGDVDATIASSEPYNGAVFDAAPRLRVIARTGVGYDAIDVAEATRRGVMIGVTPGANRDAVAEHAFAMLLALVKNVVANHTQLIAGGFTRIPTDSLRGKTLGIVGFGNIGRAMERRARAFDMNVLAADPCLPPGTSDAGTRIVSLETLLSEADFVSLHAPLVAETQQLIRAETIARMKDGAILINAARGKLVDEHALAEALRSGKIAGAGLDVFEREPPIGSPLLTAPNVLLSPHLAGVDRQAIEDMAAMAAQTIVDVFAGRTPAERIVNPLDFRTARTLPSG